MSFPQVITQTGRIEAGRTLQTAANQAAGVSAPLACRFWPPSYARAEASPRLLNPPPLLPEKPSKELRGQPLSVREKQVLRLVALGQTYSAVAIELGLTKKMVDRHVERIHPKIGAHCVAHLVHYALARGEVGLMYGA